MSQAQTWAKSAIIAMACASCGDRVSGTADDESMREREASVTMVEDAGLDASGVVERDSSSADVGVATTSEVEPPDADIHETDTPDAVTLEAGSSTMAVTRESDGSVEAGGTDAGVGSSSDGPLSSSEESSSEESTDSVDVTSSAEATDSGSDSSEPGCDGGACDVSDGTEVGLDSDAGGSCPAACVSSLFAGCVPDGYDQCLNYGYGATVCWPNGAYQEMIGGIDTSSATVFHANGDACMSMTNARNDDNSFDMQWLDGQGALVAEGVRLEDGSYTITCIDENETYYVDATTDCFPFALPFLDPFRCEYGVGYPEPGTCGY